MNRTEAPPAAIRDPLLSFTESAEHNGVSRMTFWRDVKAGRMPAAYYVAPRRPRWRRSELDAAVSASPRMAAVC